MSKTIAEINEKIKKGEAVILTAAEVKELSKTASSEEITRKVDVVTTATFGAMCSSGCFLNFGHANPPIRMEKIRLNGVPASGGVAAVDTYLGATEVSEDNPRYGGAHVIYDLLCGKEVELEAWGKGTDCYPRKHIKTKITLDDLNEAYLYNPRNAYQNYPAAVNSTKQTIYTYMGTLLANYGNVTYSTSAELSPLLNDPELRTIGLGTKIFLGGGEGYVTWQGTQFTTGKEKNNKDIPYGNSATLAVSGDLKQMDSKYLIPAYYEKYGVSIFVGIGVPIPILDEDIAKRVCIKASEIETTVLDYGRDGHPEIRKVNYEELSSGSVKIGEKEVVTAPLSSRKKAEDITEELKNRILNKDFLLTQPVLNFKSEKPLKSLKTKGVGNGKKIHPFF